jgi:hypothetical protein
MLVDALAMLVDTLEILGKCREIDVQNHRLLKVAGNLEFLVFLIDWKN